MHLRALLVRLLAIVVAVGGVSLVGSPAHAVPVSVTGSVVDADSGTGIADAYLEFDGPSYQEVFPDELGAYSVDLEPGAYDVYAYADGYEDGFVQLEVTEATTELPAIELVALPDPIAVTGTVVDAATDTGVPSAWVEAEGPSYDSAETGEDGAYTLALQPGSYWLYVSAEGYQSAEVEVEVTESTTELPLIELVALPDPLAVSGSVVDATTSTGVDAAYVEASGPSWDDAVTVADGSYAMELQPGDYTFYASAPGYYEGWVEATIAEGATTVPPIELEPLPPGISVSVNNSTFGGSVAGVEVTLSNAGGTVSTLTTDDSGEVFFPEPADGQYTVSVVPPEGMVADEGPQAVDYAGGVHYVHFGLSIDLSCEPASANAGLTNMGFESDLDGWTLGYQAESIQAVAADEFTSPWEGSKMARIGHSQPSSGESQPEGPNVMCQDFVVDEAEETFAFNVFTYDYTGFDEFKFDVVVTSPDTGETLAAYQQGAWGEGTDLKTSGWRGVSLDLADYVGDTVRLSFRAGGTSDSLYAFWAYLDSAEVNLPAPIEVTDTVIETESGSVTTDPTTGQVTVAMPTGSPSALTIQLPADCEGDAAPTSVSLVLNGQAFEGTPVGEKWEVTIPADQIESGSLSVQIVCEGETTVVTPIGQIVLYDPSGIVTDAETGEPVVGAEVHLYKVPDWSPKQEPGEPGANECETNESKGEGAPWTQPAPTDLGQLVNAASPEIEPNVNPFITNNVGYYGWNVAMGCWYVTVTAEGYEPLTSPVVGVPSEVTDLDLEVQPIAVEQPPTGPSKACTAAKAGLAAAQAALAKAVAKVKKAKKKFKKAKKSDQAAKAKKAKKKVKKAKGKAKKAKTGLANAQAMVGKHCT